MNQEIQNNFIVEPFKANLIMGKIVDENIKKQLAEKEKKMETIEQNKVALYLFNNI